MSYLLLVVLRHSSASTPDHSQTTLKPSIDTPETIVDNLWLVIPKKKCIHVLLTTWALLGRCSCRQQQPRSARVIMTGPRSRPQGRRDGAPKHPQSDVMRSEAFPVHSGPSNQVSCSSLARQHIWQTIAQPHYLFCLESFLPETCPVTTVAGLGQCIHPRKEGILLKTKSTT